MKGFTKKVVEDLDKETRVYAVENLLVLVMIGSAIALQVRRKRYGKGRGPLLLRLMDEVPEEVLPFPINLLGVLSGKKK